MTAGTLTIATVVLAILGITGVRTLGERHPMAASQHASATRQQALPPDHARILARMVSQPLAFEANQGQTDPQVKYLARGNGYTVFLTANDAVFALNSSRRREEKSAANSSINQTRDQVRKDRSAAIRLHLVGGNIHSPLHAAWQLPS